MAKIQTRFLVFIFAVIILLVILGSCFISGILFEQNRSSKGTEKISSQVIIDKINNEAFIVSKTVYLDQETEMIIDQGSEWSNFFWGQTINANALIRADVGVDFKKLEKESIKINNITKTISIDIPKAEVLDASIQGDISVRSQSGILKYLLANDPNEDHNLASNQLIKDAEISINNDEELLDEARMDSIKMLELVLKETGYKVIVTE